MYAMFMQRKQFTLAMFTRRYGRKISSIAHFPKMVATNHRRLLLFILLQRRRTIDCRRMNVPFLCRSGSHHPSLQCGFPLEARLLFTCLRKSGNNPSPYITLRIGIKLCYGGYISSVNPP